MLTKELLKAIIQQWDKTASFEDHISYLQEKKEKKKEDPVSGSQHL